MNHEELKEDKRIRTMSAEKPLKAVLKMGLPVTLGMLFMVAYNLVDTFFVGLLHDDQQLAATNLAYPVMMLLVALAGIVGNGGASYIARCIGAKKTEDANHTLTLGFEMLLLGSVVITVLGMIFINPLVTLLGAKEDTFAYTKDYVAVMFLGSLFTMGNYAVGQLLRSEGSTFYSMLGMIVGTLANIVLDPLFIFTFGMEIKGAAVATVLGNAIGLLLMLYYYPAGKTLLKPSVKLLRFDRGILREIMLVGIPHTLEQFFSTAAMLVVNNLAAAYGSLAVAGMGVANKVMSIGNYIYQGMAAGCQPLIGFNFGAKQYARLREIVKAGIIEITAMELVVMAAVGIFAPQLVGVFSDSAEVIELGAASLRAFMWTLPFVGATAVSRNTFNAIGQPLYAFGITIVRQLLLYIPFLLLFNKFWGFTGLIYAHAAEEAVCLIFATILLFAFIKRIEKKEKIE